MKSKKTALSAAAVVVLGVLLSGCASSTDGFVEEGSQDDTFERNAVKSVMKGLGAIDPDEKPVEAPPRAPLVIPPNRELRTPASPDALTRGDFPRNPEDIAAEERRRVGEGPGNDGKVMTPDQLRKYRMANQGRSWSASDSDKPGRALSPDELKLGGKSMDEAIKRTKNPEGRAGLIQPPDDYRKPSPNAPVAAPEDKKSSWWWPF
jgi:hypothetical protein